MNFPTLARIGFLGSPIPRVYATWEPAAGITLSNGGRTATASGAGGMVRTTIFQATRVTTSEHVIHARGSGIWLGMGNASQVISTSGYPGNSPNSWGVCSNGSNYAGGQSIANYQGNWATDAYGGQITRMTLGFRPANGSIVCRFLSSANGDFGVSQPFPSAYPNSVPGAYYMIAKLTSGASITSYFGESAFPSGVSNVNTGFFTP